MIEWMQCKIGELVELSQGLAINKQSKHLLKDNGLPLLRITDMFSDNYEQFIDANNAPTQCIAKPSDIIYTRTGQVGFVFRNKTGVVHNNCFKVKPKEGLDSDFLYWFLKQPSIQELANNISSGSVQLDLPHGAFKSIEIRFPKSKSHQKEIASIFSGLEAKIELLDRQNATMERVAETLFRQWFVEEAKEEWQMGKVSDLIKILSGFAFKSSSFVESGKYRLITIKGVQDGYLELNNADKIEELPDRMPDFCKLQIGDILLSLTGNVGRCCLVDTTDLLLNQRVAKLHPINQRDRAYTYFLFRQPQIKQLLEEMGKGTAQSNLSPIETSNMELIIPDNEKLTEFSAIATPWLNKLLFNKKSIQTLSHLRDLLLPKLMSGEVTVEI